MPASFRRARTSRAPSTGSFPVYSVPSRSKSRPFTFITAGIKKHRMKIRRPGPYLRRLAPEEELGRRAHHLRRPHRLEGELGVNGLDTFDAQRFSLDLLLDQIPHWAHGAGQAEGDVHVAPLLMDAHVVDKPELH